MNDSILRSVKEHLGLDPDDVDFDNEIIMDINSVFLIFYQLGLGPKEPFRITSKDETWNEFYGERKDMEAVKTDMFMRVKLMFDVNGMSSGLIDAYKKQIDELEWRLNLQVE